MLRRQKHLKIEVVAPEEEEDIKYDYHSAHCHKHVPAQRLQCD